MNKTAVIILNYNGEEMLKKYLPSVVSNTQDAEIIIADNCSTDKSVEWIKEKYPELRIIQLTQNWGFAEGYNKALKEVDSEYYVLLNSDVFTPEGWLKPLISYLEEHENCGACQPKILSDTNKEKFEYAGAAGGYIDYFGYPFCRGRIFDYVETDTGQYDDIAEIFWASGACLAIKREIFYKAGTFDSRFFAHQEEIDLCWRIKTLGYSIKCIPQSIIYHLGCGSLNYESPRKTFLNFRNNAILLYKNLPTQKYIIVRTARIFLDLIAAIQMLLQRKAPNAKAVIMGNIQFIKMKKQFKTDKKKNISTTTCKKPHGILNHLLLWKVYINKNKTFNQIDF